jgi:hypothetical protein
MMEYSKVKTYDVTGHVPEEHLLEGQLSPDFVERCAAAVS